MKSQSPKSKQPPAMNTCSFALAAHNCRSAGFIPQECSHCPHLTRHPTLSSWAAPCGLKSALLLVLLLELLAVIATPSARASTLTVTNKADSGAGTLRASIAAAAAGDTIVFASALNGQTILLTNGQLWIARNVNILGPGATNLSISGNGSNRVFFVTNSVTCTLAGLTITNGGLFPGAGGGILNQGSLTVSNCALSGNRASYGGGLCNDGTLTVKNCTISRNLAGINGGGLSNGGTATVQNSTFSGNTASDYGGGIDNGGQFESGGTLVLQNSTLTGNSGFESGGGLNAAIGTEHLTNCIIAGNFSGPVGFAPDINCAAGRVESAAYNLIGSTNNVVGIANGVNGNIVGDGTGGALAITSILNTNLAPNGGPTRTHALFPGSLARNAGLNTGAAGLTYDQRGPGFLRAVGGTVDIGAYELQAIAVVGNGLVIEAGDTTPSAADGTDFGGKPVSAGTVMRTFTIFNAGAVAVNVTNITVSSGAAADFTVSGVVLPTAVSAGASTTFTLTFNPSALGPRSSTLNITNNVSANSLYNFTIQGTGITTALTVTGITANNKVYDGTTVAALNTAGAVLVGVIAGDSVTLNTAAAGGTFTDKNVGLGKTVAVSGLTLSGAQAGNYTLTQPTTTASITPKTLTVTGITANDKVFDGTTAATLNTSGAALVGVVAGDTVTLNTAAALGKFANAGPGNDIPVFVSGLTLSGAQAGNYILTQPTITASIAPSPIAPTITCPVNIVTTVANGPDTRAVSWTATASGTPAPVIT